MTAKREKELRHVRSDVTSRGVHGVVSDRDPLRPSTPPLSSLPIPAAAGGGGAGLLGGVVWIAGLRTGDDRRLRNGVHVGDDVEDFAKRPRDHRRGRARRG
jgi:hypothetical protein